MFFLSETCYNSDLFMILNLFLKNVSVWYFSCKITLLTGMLLLYYIELQFSICG